MSSENFYITPCIGVCILDLQGICSGCKRTKEEIAKWSKMSHSERMEVMKRLGYGNRKPRG